MEKGKIMKDMTTKFFRRRKFIINKNLQYRFLIISISYIFIFFIFTIFSLFVPLIIKLNEVDITSEAALQAANQLLYLHTNFWPALLLFIVIIVLHSIRTSHRIAGPLYRINIIFESIKKGNLPKPTHLRKGDLLVADFESANQMLNIIRQQVMQIKEAHVDLSKTISECEDIYSHGSRDDLTECINKLSKKGEQLEEKLSFFKIIS